MSFKRNKRGTILDLFPWMIILVIVAIFTLIGLYLNDQMLGPLKNMLSSTPANPDIDSPQQITQTASSSLGIMDNVIVIIAGGIGLGAIILAFMIRSSPALMVLSIVVLAIALVVMAIMSNAYRAFASSSMFSTYINNNLPMTKQIMANLPVFALIFGGVILIVTYGKLKGGGE